MPEDPDDPPAAPPIPAKLPGSARVISSEDGAMASGSIGGGDPAEPPKGAAPRNGTKRSKRISEGWD